MIADLTFFGLWALFYVGFGTSLLLQAQTSVSSDSNNLRNVWQWFTLHWRVVWANLFLSTALSAVIFHLIPPGYDLGVYGRYAFGGFISNAVLDKLLFIFGARIGTKVEVPQESPPASTNQLMRSVTQ